MKNRVKIKHLILYAMIMFYWYAYSQPYYYYVLSPYEKENQTEYYSIYRYNFRTGETELFHRDTMEIYYFGWEPTQRWLYYMTTWEPGKGPIILINTSKPGNRIALPYEGEVYVYGFFYLPQKNRIYITTWEKNLVYDAETLTPVDSFSFEHIFDERTEFASEDGEFTYYASRDTVTDVCYLKAFSTTTHTVVWKKREYEIGHPVAEKVFLGGKRGLALYGYTYPEVGEGKGYYVLYSPEKDSVVCCISDDTLITDPYLSADARYLIIEETPLNPERTPSEPIHLHSGRIYVYEVTTGKLIQRLYLPSGGQVVIVDGYPDMLYYYIEKDKRSINVELSKLLIITSIDPASMYSGSGEFILTVSGKNFTAGSTVHWNGVPKETRYISDSILEASIFASDVAVADSVLITVKSADGMMESSGIMFYVLKRQEGESILTLLDTLQARLKYCYDTKQLGDRGFYTELSDHIRDAIRKYQRQDTIGCAQEIEEFYTKLRWEYQRKPKKNDRCYVSEQAYQMLYPLARQSEARVITLPPRPTGTVVEQLSALKSQIRREAETGNIGGGLLIRELERILERATKAIQRKDTLQTKLSVELFLETVRNVYERSTKKIYLKAEGYISLYYRGRYVLETLEEVREPGEEIRKKIEPLKSEGEYEEIEQELKAVGVEE